MDKRYLNIPIPMLKDLYTDNKKFFDDTFDVGVYLYSKTLTGSEEKRYKDAKKFLHVTQGCSPNTAIDNAKRILNGISDKYPMAGLEIDMYFDYYKNYKTEFEIICLAAFLAIKSILGKKPYDKTNKAMIRSRMWGYSSPKELPKTFTSLQEKYLARRQFDKIITELEINWHLKTLWNHNRGFYLSFDLSFDDLAIIIEKSKQQTKIQQLKDIKKKAINSVKI